MGGGGGGAGGACTVHVCVARCYGELPEVAVALRHLLGDWCIHPLPVGHVALLGVLRAGSHLPGATMRLLLMERILAMVEHGARLAEV